MKIGTFCYSGCVILLLVFALGPATSAGVVTSQPASKETQSGGYWSNQYTGGDIFGSQGPLNPPDLGGWNAWFGKEPTEPNAPTSGLDSSAWSRMAVPSYPVSYDTDTWSLLPSGSGEETRGLVTPFNEAASPGIVNPKPLFPLGPGTVPGTPLVSPQPVSYDQPPADLIVPPAGSAGSSVRYPIFAPQNMPFTYPTPNLSVVPITNTPRREPAATPTPEAGQQVYISDLNLRDEYVKITNSGITPVSMTGWKIVAGSTRRSITFIDWPQGNGNTFSFTLYPLITATIHYGQSGPVTATDLYWPFEKNFWNDAGDTAYLYDPNGRMVSSLTR